MKSNNKNKKSFYIILSIMLALVFTTKAFASLTFTNSAITGTSASTIDLGAGNALSLQTTNNGKIFLGTGNVGIGTTAPGYLLDVNGIINAAAGSQSGPRNAGVSIGGGQATFTNDGNLSNLFVGDAVGINTTGSIGYFNTIFGLQSGLNIPDVGSSGGHGNSFFGYGAGKVVTTGVGDTIVGTTAGNAVTTGVNDTLIGSNAGFLGSSMTTGSNNTVLGANSGNITTGSNNLIIGYSIGAQSTTASNQLNIDNIIYGTGVTGGAGNIGIGSSAPAAAFEVNGHYSSIQSAGAPTASVTGTGYSGASMVAGSTDTKGKITATVGANAGTLVVTFNSAYTTAPVCTTDANTATAQVDLVKMYSTTSTTALTLNFVASPTGGSETWSYVCMQ